MGKGKKELIKQLEEAQKKNRDLVFKYHNSLNAIAKLEKWIIKSEDENEDYLGEVLNMTGLLRFIHATLFVSN